MTNAHYTGRCSCGQVKYDITGEPVREARLADDSENRVAAKAGLGGDAADRRCA
jgi:hypothetical protein